MSEKKINLTEAEWHVMECLWKAAPQTGRQLVEGLKEKVGWSKSTTLTMLSRMTGKEIISCDESGQVRLYAPCIDREAAVQADRLPGISAQESTGKAAVPEAAEGTGEGCPGQRCIITILQNVIRKRIPLTPS